MREIIFYFYKQVPKFLFLTNSCCVYLPFIPIYCKVFIVMTNIYNHWIKPTFFQDNYYSWVHYIYFHSWNLHSALEGDQLSFHLVDCHILWTCYSWNQTYQMATRSCSCDAGMSKVIITITVFIQEYDALCTSKNIFTNVT